MLQLLNRKTVGLQEQELMSHESKIKEDESINLTLATNIQQYHSIIQNLNNQLSLSSLTVEEEQQKNGKLLEELDSYSLLLTNMTEKQRKSEEEIAYLMNINTTLKEKNENLLISSTTSENISNDERKKNNDMMKMLTKSRSDLVIMEGKMAELEGERRGEQVKVLELQRYFFLLVVERDDSEIMLVACFSIF
jgi:copper(I)-binding protein